MTPIVFNILDLIDIGGSDVIEHKLATFSSPKNPEIEKFIKSPTAENLGALAPRMKAALLN